MSLLYLIVKDIKKEKEEGPNEQYTWPSNDPRDCIWVKETKENKKGKNEKQLFLVLFGMRQKTPRNGGRLFGALPKDEKEESMSRSMRRGIWQEKLNCPRLTAAH